MTIRITITNEETNDEYEITVNDEGVDYTYAIPAGESQEFTMNVARKLIIGERKSENI